MDPHLLQFKADLKELQQRITRLESERRRLLLLGFLFAVLAAIGGWFGAWMGHLQHGRPPVQAGDSALEDLPPRSLSARSASAECATNPDVDRRQTR